MDNEIQLISDGDGLAVIGNATDVERFLVSEGLSSKDLGLQRLKSVMRHRVCSRAGRFGDCRQLRSLGEADPEVCAACP